MPLFIPSRKRPRSTKAIVDTDDETNSSSSSSSIETSKKKKSLARSFLRNHKKQLLKDDSSDDDDEDSMDDPRNIQQREPSGAYKRLGETKTATRANSFLQNLGKKKQLFNDESSSDDNDDTMEDTYRKGQEQNASRGAENMIEAPQDNFLNQGDESSVDTTELARQLQAPLERRSNLIQQNRSCSPPVEEAVVRVGSGLQESNKRKEREDGTRQRFVLDSAAVRMDETQQNEALAMGDDDSSVDTAELARQLRGEAPVASKTRAPSTSGKSTSNAQNDGGTDDFVLPEQDDSSLSSEEEGQDEGLGGSVDGQDHPPSRVEVPQNTSTLSRNAHLMHSSQPVDTAGAVRAGPSSTTPKSGPEMDDSAPFFRPINERQVPSGAPPAREHIGLPAPFAPNYVAARNAKPRTESLFLEVAEKRFKTTSHGETMESRTEGSLARQNTQALADSVLEEAAFFDNDCSRDRHALPQEPEVVDLANDSDDDDGKPFATPTVLVREGLRRSVKKSPAFLQSPEYNNNVGLHNRHDEWEREHFSPPLQNHQQDGFAEDIQVFSDDENDDVQQFGRRASGALARREQLLATQEAEHHGQADFVRGSANTATASGLQSPWGQTTTGRRRRLRNATTSNTSFAGGVILRNGDHQRTTNNPSTYAPPPSQTPVDTWNQQYTAAVASTNAAVDNNTWGTTGHSWTQSVAGMPPRNELVGGSITGTYQFTSSNYGTYNDDEESAWTRRPAAGRGRGRGRKRKGGGGWGRKGRGRGRGRGGRGRSRGGARSSSNNNNRSYSNNNTGWSASDDPNLRHVGGAEMSF